MDSASMNDKEACFAIASLTVPVRFVLVMEEGGEDWVIKPQEDMTGAESMAMTLLLFSIWHSRGYHKTDIKGYIEENKLWRHFEKVRK